MNISPLDIRKHEFRKSFRGFDPDEVLAFLDLVSIEFENLIRENSQLKDRVSSFDMQLKKYHDIENTLRETLLSAQRAREETINTAKKHADVIIREAEVKAASIVEEGRRELSRLKSVSTDLKIRKDNYLTKIRSLITSQLEMLENVDVTDEENAFAAMDAAKAAGMEKELNELMSRDSAGGREDDEDGDNRDKR
ncbi:MAG: DivIVA domain-containing protein [Candidatus Latescibacteria bacterium]|nr:DivIVA domain-containing protein [Candidatus Latescibacterota bacterium]